MKLALHQVYRLAEDFHLINVWVPHLGKESEGRRRVWVVNRKFYMGLGKRVQTSTLLATVIHERFDS